MVDRPPRARWRRRSREPAPGRAPNVDTRQQARDSAEGRDVALSAPPHRHRRAGIQTTRRALLESLVTENEAVVRSRTPRGSTRPGSDSTPGKLRWWTDGAERAASAAAVAQRREIR